MEIRDFPHTGFVKKKIYNNSTGSQIKFRIILCFNIKSLKSHIKMCSRKTRFSVQYVLVRRPHKLMPSL